MKQMLFSSSIALILPEKSRKKGQFLAFPLLFSLFSPTVSASELNFFTERPKKITSLPFSNPIHIVRPRSETAHSTEARLKDHLEYASKLPPQNKTDMLYSHNRFQRSSRLRPLFRQPDPSSHNADPVVLNFHPRYSYPQQQLQRVPSQAQAPIPQVQQSHPGTMPSSLPVTGQIPHIQPTPPLPQEQQISSPHVQPADSSSASSSNPPEESHSQQLPTQTVAPRSKGPSTQSQWKAFLSPSSRSSEILRIRNLNKYQAYEERHKIEDDMLVLSNIVEVLRSQEDITRQNIARLESIVNCIDENGLYKGHPYYSSYVGEAFTKLSQEEKATVLAEGERYRNMDLAELNHEKECLLILEKNREQNEKLCESIRNTIKINMQKIEMIKMIKSR